MRGKPPDTEKPPFFFDTSGNQVPGSVTEDPVGAAFVSNAQEEGGSEGFCDLPQVTQQSFESDRQAESTDSYPELYSLIVPRPLTLSFQCCSVPVGPSCFKAEHLNIKHLNIKHSPNLGKSSRGDFCLLLLSLDRPELACLLESPPSSAFWAPLPLGKQSQVLTCLCYVQAVEENEVELVDTVSQGLRLQPRQTVGNHTGDADDQSAPPPQETRHRVD